MKKLILLCPFVLSCNSPTEPIRQLSSYERLLAVEDSLNVALKDFYKDGGSLTFIYVIRFQDVDSIVPIVRLSLKRP